MIEFILCSLITILPDYLIRRYTQGKRWGKDITFFSMWYELRWGITACIILTVSLITLIFYYHPSTTNASPFFRTVTILPESPGRVEEVFVKNKQIVKAGDPLFSLIDATQLAAVEIAEGRIIEVEAAFSIARSELAATEGLVEQARGSLSQSQNELRMKKELRAKSANIVSDREIERLENAVTSKQGALVAAMANRQGMEAQIMTVLPSQQESAEELLEQAEVELKKTTVVAGVSGQIQQFGLIPGDIVNPFVRPAGLLIPTEGPESGRQLVQAGFSQLTAPVIRPGILAEITCLSKPFTIIPMVVTNVQNIIAAGQLRPSDILVDVQDRAKPGTITVTMEPLYPNGLDGVLPGTKCLANAYTNNHELIASGELSMAEYLYWHMVDAVGVVHAAILRVQALILPVKMLVFAGH
ncbi:MAG: biotin/lipoyl-binding protein [Halioglobus sp.]